jgi:hypothetical protein
MSIEIEVTSNIDIPIQDIAAAIYEAGDDKLAEILDLYIQRKGRKRAGTTDGFDVGSSLNVLRREDSTKFFLTMMAGLFRLDEETDSFVTRTKTLIFETLRGIEEKEGKLSDHMVIEVGKKYKHRDGGIYTVLDVSVKVKDLDGIWVEAVRYADLLQSRTDYPSYVRTRQDFRDRFEPYDGE